MDGWFNVRTWKGKVVAATATTAGIYGLYLVARKPKRNREVDLDKLLAILQASAQSMESASTSIAKEERRLRQQLRKAGKMIADDQMLEYCKQEWENLMNARQSKIYEEFGTTEAAVKKSFALHHKDTAVAKLEEQIKTIGSCFTPKIVDIPESLNEEKMMEIVSEFVKAVTKMMQTVAKDLQNKGISDGGRFIQAWQKQFSQKTPKLEAEVIAKSGYTLDVYHAAMVKYGDSSAIQEKLSLIHAEQKRIFRLVGVTLRDE